MKGLKPTILGLVLTSLSITSAQAVDLSKVPDVRRADLDKVNNEGFQRDERPKHCTYANDKQNTDPACYDFVLSQNEMFISYAGKTLRLGKPLTVGNKAKENTAGLDKVIENIVRVYSGTEKAILANKPELNLSLAGLFNTFNRSITAVEPYVLSIANGHYDKKTLERLDDFDKVFSNGWRKSAPAMVKYQGITEEKAVGSTNYYKSQLEKIRDIITQLNKYYQ